MTPDKDISAIAAGLTMAQRGFILAMPRAGTFYPGQAETRRFLLTENLVDVVRGQYRFNELGLAVRAHLEQSHDRHR